MKVEICNHIAEKMGQEAVDELLDQAPALKEIVDLSGNKITGEMSINSEQRMVINMLDMDHWNLTSISTLPDGRVFFTAQHNSDG